MQYPPPGPGYGHPQPGGYGPQGPYYPPPYGGGPPPPPKSSSNVAVIAIVVIVAFVVMAGGGCLVCGMLATVGAVASSGDAASPPLGTATSEGDPTVGRTPLAIKLESALRNDGIPFDHVECPLAPPSTGSFSCAVLPPNEGDPAEVTVTNGPSGMSYKLQEGFVILDGAKLAATFAGIATRVGSPRMTVPCFRGKIMKHADTSFTCEVQNGGAVVGHVTTNVIGRSGEVKMDYLPSGQPKSGAAPSTLDGIYACMMLTNKPNNVPRYIPSTLPRFTIAGGEYTSGGKVGRFRTAGEVVLFLDGAYDGWQGLPGTNTTGRYILFRGSNHGDAQPGVATKVGDHQCYAQK